MPAITSVLARTVYNSRGSLTIECDVQCEGGHTGRACAPSGASVGIHEAKSFAKGGPTRSAEIVSQGASKLIGADAADTRAVFEAMHEIDPDPGYSTVGGGAAYAVSIAAAEAASRAQGVPLYESLGGSKEFRFPFPLGNILGGGAHAGPGTPDIQEILVCAVGAKNVREAIETNLAVHAQLLKVLQKKDPSFTNGRGDEGGWAPKLDNMQALELSAAACEELGYTLGKEVALGADFASSTQWDGSKYDYARAGFSNSPEEQIDYAAGIIRDFKLIYAEDAVHEEAFSDMAELAKKFPKVLITGDDLTVTNARILRRAAEAGSCNAAILKVNQAGGLHDALEFAAEAGRSGISLVTSHRSGESVDSHMAHIGIATGSKMLKAGIVGGERVAKLNELARLSGHGLIRGMATL